MKAIAIGDRLLRLRINWKFAVLKMISDVSDYGFMGTWIDKLPLFFEKGTEIQGAFEENIVINCMIQSIIKESSWRPTTVGLFDENACSSNLHWDRIRKHYNYEWRWRRATDDAELIRTFAKSEHHERILFRIRTPDNRWISTDSNEFLRAIVLTEIHLYPTPIYKPVRKPLPVGRKLDL